MGWFESAFLILCLTIVLTVVFEFIITRRKK
jgi:hypothetical protein